MPLETATYIHDLNSANPGHTDQINQADAHLRLLKAVLIAQFPNFTSAALNSTQAQIDAAASAFPNGAAMLADAGAFFKTNTTDGITNPAPGEIDVVVGGVAKLKVKPTGLEGPGVVPIGGSMPWYSNTLPSASFGTYAFLNGQAVSRATYSALFAILGTAYGTGDGSTTFNLPDLRDNVLVGKGDMGGVSAAGRITNFVSTTLGNLFGECLHLLGVTELPAHTHSGTTSSDGAHTHTVTAALGSGGVAGGGGSQNTSNQALTTSSAGAHTHTFTTDTGTGGAGSHNNVQPSLVCNWVMRIA